MLHLNRVVTRSHASLCADSTRRWSEDEAIYCLERCKMKSPSAKRRVPWKLFYLIIQKCLDENIFNKAFVQKGLGYLFLGVCLIGTPSIVIWRILSAKA